MIPESAITDNLAETLLDSHEAKVVPYGSFSCGICGASLSSTTMDKYIATYYPSYSKVRSASSKYNCHLYAWYSTTKSYIPK